MSPLQLGRSRSAYVGLGANLGDPQRQILLAIDAIAALDGVTLQGCSPLYRTAPMGLPGQPDYCNAVCEVATARPADWLMGELLRIERSLGRFRDGRRWGARMIDLDLLHVDGECSDRPELMLPHPGIAQRNFVLVPLADVAPGLFIPRVGAVALLARDIGREGLAPWPAAAVPMA